jgi:hypothetical protein
MRMQVDHHFRIGRAHLANGMPCQDYAATGVMEAGGWAVVSDGCSGGGRTDLGARLVAQAAALQLTGRQPPSLEDMRSALALDAVDMLATCVSARWTAGGATLSIVGDGAAAIVRSDGSVDMIRAAWAGNMPFYPAYGLAEREIFLARHDFDGGGLVVAHRRWRDGGCDTTLERVDTQAGIGGVTLSLAGQELADVVCVAVFTDGVDQVPGRDWGEAARELLAFRSTSGRFVARRLNRMMRDWGAGAGLPADDIAMAAIHREVVS